MKPIQIYISVNTLPNTSLVLEYLLNRISQSYLKDQKIILCHSKDWKKVSFDLDIEYVDTQCDYTAFEYPALRKIWQDSIEQNEFYGLYLHCKGSSKINQRDLDNCFAWTDYMFYGVLDQADRCVDYLSNGADLVGSMWHWHFKGNFFWFNSSYTKKLADPYSLNTVSRFDSEYWCATPLWYDYGFIPKVKNLFYIPKLQNDSQFLEFKQLNYVPNLDHQYALIESFDKFFEKKWYGVFDRIIISAKDYQQYQNELPKFLNFDGKVIII